MENAVTFVVILSSARLCQVADSQVVPSVPDSEGHAKHPGVVGHSGHLRSSQGRPMKGDGQFPVEGVA